jgi:hypothetical protein
MVDHVQTTIRYDGPALIGHEMDVKDLAPALLALAEIVHITNRRLNGERASIRVLVNADVEQQCFQLDLSLVQSLLDQAQTFFGKENVATAKTIAEIIGLAAGAGGGIFGLYKLLAGKAPEGGVVFTTTDANGATIININGDGNTVTVSPEVAAIASDPEVARQVKTVLRPLEQPGYSDFTVLRRGKPVLKIERPEALAILGAPPLELTPPVPPESQEETIATGPAWVDTSHFRGNAKWTLLWSGQRIDAKMPEDFIAAFQANETVVVPNAKLTVRMKVATTVGDDGMPTGVNTFEVVEVIKVDLPPKAATQLNLLTSRGEL